MVAMNYQSAEESKTTIRPFESLGVENNCDSTINGESKHGSENCNGQFFNIRTNAIACIGAGYVGGPTMAVIADRCHDIQVYVLDTNEEKIAQWNSDTLPIYEPGLYEVVKRRRGINLHFTSNAKFCIEECDILFISVSTPTKTFGNGAGSAVDLRHWEGAATSILNHAKRPKIIVEKSTVPVEAAEVLTSILKSNMPDNEWCVVSNPEFLSEGSAIADLVKPDRVLIGSPQTAMGKFATNVLFDLYSHWVPPSKIFMIDTNSSELAKLVANAFLAQKISSINSIGILCEEVGADVEHVAKAVGMDSRIGHKFMQPSVGFGGSCFRKDLLSLAYICERKGLTEVAEYWKSVLRINELRKEKFAHGIISSFFNNICKKRICILGFAFKKDTGDVRDTAGVDVCRILMKDRATLCIYDPKVKRQAALEEMRLRCDFDEAAYKSQFLFMDSPHEAAKGASAIAIITEWDEFKTYDYSAFYKLMAKPASLFDGRNLLDREKLYKIGFNVHSIGHPDLTH